MITDKVMAAWLEQAMEKARATARLKGWRQTDGGNWVCVKHPNMRWRYRDVPAQPCDQCLALDPGTRKGHL